MPPAVAPFVGFKALDANFTAAPNQFFDVVLREEDCVVKVVGFLIRETLGWQDRVTKARRVEAGLPLSEFMARGMARNSARKGIDLALERGYIVKTGAETPRSPARYALRWEDEAAQAEAIRRERLANSDPVPVGRGSNFDGRGSNFDPVKFCPPRGSNFDPLPIYSESGKKKKKEILRVLTLNVGEEVNFVAPKAEEAEPARAAEEARAAEPAREGEGAGEAPDGVSSRAFETQAAALVRELQDRGSERRHKQLLAICERHGLGQLPAQALHATRQRLAHETTRGLLEKPGAYYQRILVGLLAAHQVFVPTAGEDDAAEVRRLARESLGL